MPAIPAERDASYLARAEIVVPQYVIAGVAAGPMPAAAVECAADLRSRRVRAWAAGSRPG